MSHIDHINESSPSFGPSQAKSGKSQPADAFQDALSKALGNKVKTKAESSPSGALKEITSMGPAVMSPSDIVSGKTDTLLGLLEAYSTKLENPEISLKSIAPDLEKIKADAGTLEKDTQTLSDEDASLKAIATQTIVTAQTEYLKFQRGDYSA